MILVPVHLHLFFPFHHQLYVYLAEQHHANRRRYSQRLQQPATGNSHRSAYPWNLALIILNAFYIVDAIRTL